MTSSDTKVRIGDQVLIRARVIDLPNPRELVVQVMPGDHRWRAPRESIDTIIPLEESRTNKGFTVPTTRRAIASFDERIEAFRQLIATRQAADENELFRLELASLEGIREDLVQQLRDINVDPYPGDRK